MAKKYSPTNTYFERPLCPKYYLHIPLKHTSDQILTSKTFYLPLKYSTKLLKAFRFEPQRYTERCCMLMTSNLTMTSKSPKPSHGYGVKCPTPPRHISASRGARNCLIDTLRPLHFL